MLAAHNKSVATEENLRFRLRDLGAPLLRHGRMLSVMFLFIASLTLLLAHARLQMHQLHFMANVTVAIPSSIKLRPAHSPAFLILIAACAGLLIGLSVTYLIDYSDPCFHSSAQVVRTLRVPLVVAIPKRPS
jgi:hypothetical protein